MGAVWLGRDEVLGRPVAIKRIGVAAGETGPDLGRAEREAKIAASLNHPHIVGVFDLVSDDDHQWMVMEYVEGATLSELVRANGPLSPDDAAAVIAQAASALAAAHANGVVHRDVKPSNILVRDDGHVKLTDFGIARGQADAALTQTGLVTGSPAYLAPEVASGQQATTASDIWSLGATLFHALSGHPPYDATDNVLGALYRIVNEEPPRVEDAGWLGPLLEATMNRSPAQRWSMAEVERFLARDGAALGPRPAFPAAAVVTPATQDPTLPTQPMHVVPGVHDDLASAAVAGASAAPPVPPVSGGPAPGEPGRRRNDHPNRRAVLPGLIVALVALLVVAIVALALQGDPQENLTADGADTAAEPWPSASLTPEPTPTPTPPPPTPEVPTRAAMESFISSYLDLASSDPASAFQQLTPQFQSASTRYEEFWGSVSDPQLLEFSADPSTLTVTYTYRYQQRGTGRQVDEESLQLVATDDGFLIAGPA